VRFTYGGPKSAFGGYANPPPIAPVKAFFRVSALRVTMAERQARRKWADIQFENLGAIRAAAVEERISILDKNGNAEVLFPDIVVGYVLWLASPLPPIGSRPHFWRNTSDGLRQVVGRVRRITVGLAYASPRSVAFYGMRLR
jgi:hypothetical protein